MKYEIAKTLKPSDFKRRFGVQSSTYLSMVKEVKKQEKKRKKKNKKNAGRKPTLCPEDEILLTLTYWREYRTQFHLGTDYGISEAVTCRTIQKIENILSKCKRFQLPKNKKKQESNIDFEVILVDATESPIERPKKNKKHTIQGKSKSTR